MRNLLRGLLFFSLLGVALTASAQAQTQPAPTQEKRSARLYFGGTTIVNNDGSTGNGVTLGYESAAGGKKVAGMWGIEFLGVDLAGTDAFFPVFSVNGGLHLTPWPDARVIPYVNAELGASFVFLFIPAPTVSLGLGVQIPVGDELRLDIALQDRAVANPFDGQTTNATTLALGLGF